MMMNVSMTLFYVAVPPFYSAIPPTSCPYTPPHVQTPIWPSSFRAVRRSLAQKWHVTGLSAAIPSDPCPCTTKSDIGARAVLSEFFTRLQSTLSGLVACFHAPPGVIRCAACGTSDRILSEYLTIPMWSPVRRPRSMPGGIVLARTYQVQSPNGRHLETGAGIPAKPQDFHSSRGR